MAVFVSIRKDLSGPFFQIRLHVAFGFSDKIRFVAEKHDLTYCPNYKRKSLMKNRLSNQFKLCTPCIGSHLYALGSLHHQSSLVGPNYLERLPL